MKPGDLVKLVSLPPHWRDVGFEIGDIAILIEIDWEVGSEQKPILGSKGRGVFYFPTRLGMFKRNDGRIGYSSLFENFEVISEIR